MAARHTWTQEIKWKFARRVGELFCSIHKLVALHEQFSLCHSFIGIPLSQISPSPSIEMTDLPKIRSVFSNMRTMENFFPFKVA